MAQGDSVTWLLFGVLLMVGGLVVELSGFLIVRYLGGIAITLGLVAIFLGLFGAPRPVVSPSHA